TSDAHFGKKPAVKAGDLTAGGNGHNHDTTVQSNQNTPLGNGCFTFKIPALVTNASASVALGTPIDDVATLSGGTTAPNISGTITFNAYSNAGCTTSVYTSVVTVNGNGNYT